MCYCQTVDNQHDWFILEKGTMKLHGLASDIMDKV